MSLKFGDSGQEVLALKQRINALPASLGIPRIPLGVDRDRSGESNDDDLYFDAQTKRAVEALQRLAVSRGLMRAEDIIGIFGPKSENALNVITAGSSVGPVPGGIRPETPPTPMSALPATYRPATRRGFVDPEPLNVTALPPEVRGQANAQGWVMMFMPGDVCQAAQGTGLTGTFYVANIRTGETHAYPAVTGGLTGQSRDDRTNGPLAGCRTDYWGTRDDAVNAIYSNGRHIRNYTSSLGVHYRDVIKIDDTIPGRGGFLIHKANNRGGTIGCVGLQDDDSIREVGTLVERYGIGNMVVLNDSYRFNQTVGAARPTTPVDYRPAPSRDNDNPFQPLLNVIDILVGGRRL